MNSADSAPREHRPLVETYEVLIAAFLLAAGWFVWYLASERYHLTGQQVAELACYLLIGTTALYSATYRLLTARSRREKQWPHPPLVASQNSDEAAIRQAWNHVP